MSEAWDQSGSAEEALKMSFDTVIMGSSADRSGADVALPVAVGEVSVSANGVPGTGTQWYPKYPGFIVNAIVNSETAAMVECRFRKTTDADYQKVPNTHLQSAQHSPEMINNLAYPIMPGDAIEASGENAGAVLDILALYITKDGKPAISAVPPPGGLPPGTVSVRATGTVTAVADSLAIGTIAFDDFTVKRDKIYQIHGFAAGGKSATPNEGVFTRLRFLEGPNKENTPGVPCADATKPMMFYGNFGQFRGQTLPQFEHVELNAGAESVEMHFLLKEL